MTGRAIRVVVGLCAAIVVVCASLIGWRVEMNGERKLRRPAERRQRDNPARGAEIAAMGDGRFDDHRSSRRSRRRPTRRGSRATRVEGGVAGENRRQRPQDRKPRLFRRSEADRHRRRLYGQVSRGRPGRGRARAATRNQRAVSPTPRTPTWAARSWMTTAAGKPPKTP